MDNYGAELVGKGTLRFHESADISIRVTRLTGRRGTLSYSGDEVYVRRLGARSWEVRSEGRRYVLVHNGSCWLGLEIGCDTPLKGDGEKDRELTKEEYSFLIEKID